jgi:hypothetical protein
MVSDLLARKLEGEKVEISTVAEKALGRLKG